MQDKETKDEITASAQGLEDALREDQQATTGDIARYISSPEAEITFGDPPLLSRKQRQARKGLPSAENLRKLAIAWLETACQLWPELVKAGVLPKLNPHIIDKLVGDFERRFVSGQADEFRHSTPRCWKALAAGYLRYSDDNSNPRSLDDQLVKQLHRARAEGRFLPWEYVFGDASVTARTHLRRGYRLAKETMERFKSSDLDTLYFDDFGRATRSGIESYRLAKLMERVRKRLIGVSDGFDLSSPGADVQVAAAGMFNSWFIRQLRDKVLRGMKGAARRGTSTGKVRLGYRLVPKLDEHGRPIMQQGKSKNHKPVMVPAIWEENIAHVNQAARWFAYDLKAYKWIARRFNLLKVGGRTNWTGNEIRYTLACPIYIGVVIYNRTRTVLDEETGELTIEENPRCDWVIRIAPELRAWTDELWKAVRRRAARVRDRSPNTGRKYHLCEMYPVTLLSGTLVCGSCQQFLQLIRSDRKNNYRQYGCPRGCGHFSGCTHSSSKSARFVESAVLNWVRERILSEENVTALVDRCNAHLVEEAKRPRLNMEPLKKQIADLTEKEQSLMRFVLQNRDAHDMTAYLDNGDELRKQLKALRQHMRERMAENAPTPPPLDLATVLNYIQKMPDLLNQSVEKSAVLLRALTGKIVVNEVQEPGKHRKTWVGTVRTDVVRFLAVAACELDCPFRDTLEHLCNRKRIMPQSGTIRLENVPNYQRLAPAAKEMLDAGASVNSIASSLGITWATAKLVINFALTGARPSWKSPGKKTGMNKGKVPKYLEIADIVVALRDKENMPVTRIVKWLKERRGIQVAVGTVRRAWESQHRDIVREAANCGKRPEALRRYTYLGAEVFRTIGAMNGTASVSKIAARAGCSPQTVYRELARLKTEAGKTEEAACMSGRRAQESCT